MAEASGSLSQARVPVDTVLRHYDVYWAFMIRNANVIQSCLRLFSFNVIINTLHAPIQKLNRLTEILLTWRQSHFVLR